MLGSPAFLQAPSPKTVRPVLWCDLEEGEADDAYGAILLTRLAFPGIEKRKWVAPAHAAPQQRRAGVMHQSLIEVATLYVASQRLGSAL